MAEDEEKPAEPASTPPTPSPATSPSLPAAAPAAPEFVTLLALATRPMPMPVSRGTTFPCLREEAGAYIAKGWAELKGTA